MRILIDVDGSLCRCENLKIERISKIMAKKKIPWIIAFLGICLTKQKINEEMVEIINSPFHEVFVNTARPKQLKKITTDFLKKNGVKIEGVDCLGLGEDIVDKKVANALGKKVDVVVDDDENVLKAVAREGITGCSPDVFKKFFDAGIIR